MTPIPPNNRELPAVEQNSASTWHILGAGAMGCLWAARFWQHPGINPVLLLRNMDTFSAYRHAAGITLEHEGELLRCPVPAITVAQLTEPVTHLLLATKAQDAAAALESVSPFLAADARIILLQNGLRQLELARQWADKRVYCLSTSHGAWLSSRFHVVHAGIGETRLGQPDGRGDGRGDDRGDGESDCQALLAQLPADSMHIRCDHNIADRLWRKFAVNCAANALTVVHNCSNGELLTIPAARQQLLALCAEIERIMGAIPGAPAFPVFPEVERVLQATAANFSSTLQDVRKGKATELPELNGYLCELAEQHGAGCNLNCGLYDAVVSAYRNGQAAG